jgi:hypothetical protein
MRVPEYYKEGCDQASMYKKQMDAAAIFDGRLPHQCVRGAPILE